MLNRIDKAFNGTKEETGYESVVSFYKKSSYGKLNFTFDVMKKWYTPSRDYTYYDNDEASQELMEDAFRYFDATIDYSKYDCNNDGNIDAIWFIYNCSVNYDDSNSIYWAFTDWIYSDIKADGKNLYTIGFAGTDFMDENENLEIDAHTYIHETGHMMGADDYYDYNPDEGYKYGLYGSDIMDNTIGDHNPVTKMLFGWIDPTIVEYGKGRLEYELTSFQENGDFLILANHTLTSIYDEYFVVEFYNQDGLNAFDKQILDNDAKGIRIFHVDSHKNIVNGKVQFNGGQYSTGFKYDNSDTDKPFIENLRADFSSNMEEYLHKESLYTPNGKVFGLDSWKNYKLNDNSNLFFTLSVLSISTNTIKIVIEM